MKKIVRLTESDLNRIVRRTINEMDMGNEETESVDTDAVLDNFMKSIAHMSHEKQLELVNDMMFQFHFLHADMMKRFKYKDNR
jgi:hypothetical protein